MVECCQPTEASSNGDLSDTNLKSPDGSGAASPLQSDRENGAAESVHCPVYERLDTSVDETSSSASAVQSSDMNGTGIPGKPHPGHPISPPETSAGGFRECFS
ncbi:hypothetical protein GBA52_001025 [Prunus armeniaca]|nr:hypothetical protein GBA52_001025 [Prunus armeniaca]